MRVELLILGAGWTSTFLTPLCAERHITCAATSRSGRDSTIKFEFDPDSDDLQPYNALPDAQTILITFPIEKKGASERLVNLYKQSRKEERHYAAFIQLGSTGVWDGHRKDKSVLPQPVESRWYDRHSGFIPNARAAAEHELLCLSPATPTTVINLAGLWGGTRSMRNWVGRVAPSKDVLKNKGSIHMIHGIDVARAILAVHGNFSKAQGQRWILTDGRVYDWWDLASAWGSHPVKKDGSKAAIAVALPSTALAPTMQEEERGPQARWVRELMEEQGVRALPRNIEILGRALDSREFWVTFNLTPLKARLEE